MRCSEILNYNTYNQPMVLFGIMGFGGAMDEVPFLLSPGVLTMAWGSVVRQIAAGLGVTLTDVTEWYEREAAPEDFEVDAGTINGRDGCRACTSRCVAWSATAPWSCSST